MNKKMILKIGTEVLEFSLNKENLGLVSYLLPLNLKTDFDGIKKNFNSYI